jgi:hypothetical protein
MHRRHQIEGDRENWVSSKLRTLQLEWKSKDLAKNGEMTFKYKLLQIFK